MATVRFYVNHPRILSISTQDDGETALSRPDECQSHDNFEPGTHTGLGTRMQAEADHLPPRVQVPLKDDWDYSLLSQWVEHTDRHVLPESDGRHQNLLVFSVSPV